MTRLDKILEKINILGITELEFTQRLGVSKATVSEWKKGKTKSYNRHISKIADVLGVDVEELMDDPQEESPFSSAALADNIEKIVETKGYNIEELLAELNLKPDIIKKMKKGMTPTLEVIKAFSKKLEVPFEVLYGIKEDISFEPISNNCVLYSSEAPEIYEANSKANKQELGIYKKLSVYFDRLSEEDQDYILGEMIRLHKKSQEQ
ncbi:MAG: helix-turn-helix domain-containing protein [Aminipila sp.]